MSFLFAVAANDGGVVIMATKGNNVLLAAKATFKVRDLVVAQALNKCGLGTHVIW
ncbi:MAG: hypothetical protein KIT50_12175 [Bacteroidetes bacterium]|nr:hypothetical protein [Bacteroidota bacterium]